MPSAAFWLSTNDDPRLRQVRDAVIAMLDAWTGDRGRVPVEKLAAPLVDATLAAPKASPDAKVRCATHGVHDTDMLRLGQGLQRLLTMIASPFVLTESFMVDYVVY